MKDTLAIEMAPFVLAENVTEETLLEASERLEREFLGKCEGYIGRILTRSADGSFADILFWQTASKFEKALEHAPASGACANYFGCMAPEDAFAGKGISIFHAVKQYGFTPNIGG